MNTFQVDPPNVPESSIIVRWNSIEQRFLRSRWLSDPVLWLLLLWGLFIVYATLLPFNFSAPADLIRRRIERIWTHPLTGGSWQDVEGNVLLFVPWGFLLAMELARRGFGFIVTVAAAMCTGALLSGSVEVVQLFAPSRTGSFIDLVTNSFGATVGALIGWPWVRLVWPVVSVRLRHWITARPLLTCALVTGVVMLFAGLSPFSFRLSAHDVKAAVSAAQLIPFGRQAVEPVRSAKPLNWAAELLTWTLAGGLFALAARESRLSRGAVIIAAAVAASVLLSLAVETCQLAVPARDVDATSMVLALLGSALGAGAVIRLGNADSHRLIAPAIAIWCLAVIFTVWNPPHFTAPARPYWRLERVVPFWSYFRSRTLADLADVIGQVLIFMPLGVLLAARTNRQSFAGALIFGLLFGVVIEVGQAFLPARTTDMSDAITAAAGAGLGLALWRWGEWTRASSVGAIRYRVGRRTGIRG
jgi:glycopeptide antibiotics resistance protein